MGRLFRNLPLIILPIAEDLYLSLSLSFSRSEHYGALGIQIELSLHLRLCLRSRELQSQRLAAEALKHALSRSDLGTSLAFLTGSVHAGLPEWSVAVFKTTPLPQCSENSTPLRWGCNSLLCCKSNLPNFATGRQAPSCLVLHCCQKRTPSAVRGGNSKGVSISLLLTAFISFKFCSHEHTH